MLLFLDLKNEKLLKKGEGNWKDNGCVRHGLTQIQQNNGDKRLICLEGFTKPCLRNQESY